MTIAAYITTDAEFVTTKIGRKFFVSCDDEVLVILDTRAEATRWVRVAGEVRAEFRADMAAAKAARTEARALRVAKATATAAPAPAQLSLI